MNKQEFLGQLRLELSGLPQDDIAQRLAFYSEMIDDRIEEGLSEEEAVSAVGSVADITAQVATDFTLRTNEKEIKKIKKQPNPWLILLLILGSPIWLSLLIAALAVILSLYITLWALIISLWAVFGSLLGCVFGFAIAGLSFALSGDSLQAVAIIASGIICAGLSIFMFYGCKAVTNAVLILTKRMILWIKSSITKKEETL